MKTLPARNVALVVSQIFGAELRCEALIQHPAVITGGVLTNKLRLPLVSAVHRAAPAAVHVTEAANTHGASCADVMGSR